MVFFLLINYGLVPSQNHNHQIISSNSVDKVVVNGNQIFKIEVSTHDLSEIWIQSQIDGEYQDQYQIIGFLENGVLNFQLEKNPANTIPDDKRNAHKVIAAEFQLRIPSGLDLDLVSDIASAVITGQYDQISIQLSEGYCKIEGNADSAVVNTVEGNIVVVTDTGSIIAKSRYGKVNVQEIGSMGSNWQLRSIRGNITVVKRE